ncbi:DUF4259 domain-containing protein [Vallitalea okinawensis]|uniref:DUF4259 domain-containing protein n=1 Tax=Vallitalea okinawensis TaxID=2078660 RepID=UPI000CFC8FDF|nr:DUF4259 domain-containing protein [Vallitalea okinawensis]
MGAWGTGLFEDDIALDCFEELCDSKINNYILRALEIVDNGEYLDYDECQSVIVSGCVVDVLLNDASYNGIDKSRITVKKQDMDDVLKLKESVIKALGEILSDRSEIKELWEENEEEYLNWRKNIEDLINRLSS